MKVEKKVPAEMKPKSGGDKPAALKDKSKGGGGGMGSCK